MENIFEGLGEVFKSIKKEKERPKTMKEILKTLIDGIESYISEMLDPLFIDKEKRYRETFVDWDYQKLKEPKELLEEIYKDSNPYTMEDEHDYCPREGEGCNKDFAKDFDWDSYYKDEIERPKECHECFLEWKNEWCESYKVAMKIGLAYIKTYLKANTQKLRKEYKSSFNAKKITEF